MSKITLSEMIQKANDLESEIIESGGELTPELEARILEIDLSVKEKVDAVSVVCDRLFLSAEYWEARAAESSRIAKSIEKSRDRLRDHIKSIMNLSGKTELEGVDVRFKLVSGRPMLATEPDELDPSYTKQKITNVIDQEKLRSDLEKGPVKGAQLIPSFSLRTYPNKKGQK